MAGDEQKSKSASIPTTTRSRTRSSSKLGYDRPAKPNPPANKSQKRKNSSEPDLRESSRPRMSEPSTSKGSVPGAASTRNVGGGKKAGAGAAFRPSVLTGITKTLGDEASKNRNTTTTNNGGRGDAGAAAATGGGNGTAGGGTPGATSGAVPQGGGTSVGADAAVNISDLDIGKDLQVVIQVLQNTFSTKLDQKIEEIKETFNNRVTRLEGKLDDMEGSASARDKRVEELSMKVDTIPVDIQRGVATAMAKEAGSIACEIKKLKKRQDEVEEAFTREVTGRVDNSNGTSAPNQESECSARYWEARKCAKMSPTPGKRWEEMREGVKNFIYETLMVDESEFSMDHITSIRRVKSFGTLIRDECLVVFSDVDRRDFVYSHARNLANQGAGRGLPISGCRSPHIYLNALEH